MQAHRDAGSRTIEFTDIPPGKYTKVPTLSVCVNYTGDEAHLKNAITLDNVILPLLAAAPDMLEALQTVLIRLDLEAAERGPGAVFPCAAMRDDIRAILAKATGCP